MELSLRRSQRELIIAIIVAIGLWAIYAFIGPGSDFKIAYTDMVLKPELLSEVPVRPWTLNPPWQNWFMAAFVTMPGRSGYLSFHGLHARHDDLGGLSLWRTAHPGDSIITHGMGSMVGTVRRVGGAGLSAGLFCFAESNLVVDVGSLADGVV